MADKKIQIRRYDGSSWSQIYPVTSYNYLVDVPTNFPPSAHTHPGMVYYAYCDSSASAVNKSISCSELSTTSTTLEDNTKLVVFFKYTNTATNPTFKVNNTPAIGAYLTEDIHVGSTEWESWPEKSYQMFIYHAALNKWLMVGYRNITSAMNVDNNTLQLRKED